MVLNTSKKTVEVEKPNDPRFVEREGRLVEDFVRRKRGDTSVRSSWVSFVDRDSPERDQSENPLSTGIYIYERT